MRAKVSLLKALLSNDDIEAKLGSGIAAGLEKFSSDDVEQTLHDFQYGPSTIGPNYGEGRRLTLKLSSRWESLNTADSGLGNTFSQPGPGIPFDRLGARLGSLRALPSVSALVLRRDRELIQKPRMRNQPIQKSRSQEFKNSRMMRCETRREIVGSSWLLDFLASWLLGISG